MAALTEELLKAAAQAWEAQLQWEASRTEAAPYDAPTRLRAVCQRICHLLGLQVPGDARHFPAEVEAAAAQGRPQWPS